MFWIRFSELCKKNNVSPNAVCNKLGLSTATATHWKNGTMPKGDILLKVSDYFSCSVDYLLGKNETTEKAFYLELIEAYKTHPEHQASINALLGINACHFECEESHNKKSVASTIAEEIAEELIKPINIE